MTMEKEIPQPMDIMQKLREAVRPLGLEIYKFELNNDDVIKLDLKKPNAPYSMGGSYLEDIFPCIFPTPPK